MSVLDEYEVMVKGISVRKIGAAITPNKPGGRRSKPGGRGGGGIGRGPAIRVANFDPDAEDADGDQIVQEGTTQERPLAVRGKPPSLPDAPDGLAAPKPDKTPADKPDKPNAPDKRPAQPEPQVVSLSEMAFGGSDGNWYKATTDGWQNRDTGEILDPAKSSALGLAPVESFNDDPNDPLPAPQPPPLPTNPEELLAQRRQRAAEKAKAIEEAARTKIEPHQLQLARRNPYDELLDMDNDPEVRWDRENPTPNRGDFPTGPVGDDQYDLAWEEYDTAREEYLTYAPDREELVYEVVNDVFGGEFVAGDGKSYRISVDYVEENFTGAKMQGTIRDPASGKKVAIFERTLQSNGTVGHDHLKVEKEFQGKGIASAFNARNEELYRAMGFDSIEVHGVSNSNGYKGATHWPKNGFDWANENEREKFLSALQAIVDRHQEAILIGGQTPITRPRVVGLADGKFQTVQEPVFDTADQGRELSRLLALAAEEDFETGQIRAGDLLFWPGAEDYFASRTLEFLYTRQL